jgi:hypothetical protein
MRGTLRQFLGAAALVASVTFCGCKQQEGDRCEVNSDCVSGLVCNLSSNPVNGTCQTSATTPTVPAPDAGIPTDGGAVVPDAAGAPDQAVAPDGPVEVHPEAAAPLDGPTSG